MRRKVRQADAQAIYQLPEGTRAWRVLASSDHSSHPQAAGATLMLMQSDRLDCRLGFKDLGCVL